MSGLPERGTPAQLNKAIAAIEQIVGEMSLEVANKGRQVSYYRNLYPAAKDDLLTYVSKWLTELAEVYNLKNEFTLRQAVEIADAILHEFWYMKLAEIAYFIRRAKAGVFGDRQYITSLNQPLILQWLREFDVNERSEAVFVNQQKKITQHNAYKPEKLSPEESDRIISLLYRLKAELPKPYQSLREKLQDPEYKAWAREINKQLLEKQAEELSKQASLQNNITETPQTDGK